MQWKYTSLIIMDGRLCIPYYQEIMLRLCFEDWHLYPEKEFAEHLKGVIPSLETQVGLMEAIMAGGSVAYNAFLQMLQDHYPNDYPEMYVRLSSHGVTELFRWVYISTLTGQVMNRGLFLYDDKTTCLENAQFHVPSFDTYDGVGSESAKLCVESVCQCLRNAKPHDEMPRQPCPCFKYYSKIMKYLEWKPKQNLKQSSDLF